MASIQWSEKMSVENSTIDQQHKMLISMVNEIYEAMGSGKGNDVIANIVTKLAQYTKTHFSHEESYMSQMGYPSLPEHQTIHRNLIQKVQDIQGKISSGQSVSSVTLAGFLKDWLTTHIMNEDMKYASFSKVGV